MISLTFLLLEFYNYFLLFFNLIFELYKLVICFSNNALQFFKLVNVFYKSFYYKYVCYILLNNSRIVIMFDRNELTFRV